MSAVNFKLLWTTAGANILTVFSSIRLKKSARSLNYKMRTTYAAHCGHEVLPGIAGLL